jgi:rod shape-determining protein MreC
MRIGNYAFLGFLILVVGVLFVVPRDIAARWKENALTITAPAFKGMSWLRTRIQGVGYDIKTIDQIRLENQRLRGENAQMRAENEALRNMEKENQELKRALKFQASSPFHLLIARVIAREPSSWWQYVTIDRGTEDGIKVDQAVVSTRGLIGKIVKTTAGASQIVLLGDENCRVSAQIEGNNEMGIVVGQPTEIGAVQCRMTFISKTTAVEIGKRVYTSGLGGVFPQGILIGEVVSVVPSTSAGGFGLYQEVIISPSAELSNIHEVFVVVGARKP